MLFTIYLPVENDTCVHNRSVGNILPPEGASFDELMDWYAGEILGQIPCMRMMDPTGRKKLYNDPSVYIELIFPFAPDDGQ